MPRRKAVEEPDSQQIPMRSLRKRNHQELEAIPESDQEETSPVKRQRSLDHQSPSATGETNEHIKGFKSNSLEDHAASEAESLSKVDPEETPKPAPKRRGRPPKKAVNDGSPTPKANRTALFETPTKKARFGLNADTPGGADRSAKRKSTRALIEHVVGDDLTDEEEYDGLAQQIYESSEDEDALEGDNAISAEASGVDEVATPSKSTPRRKAQRKKPARSPTPPRDLPPHELYFAHNKPGRSKTSNNTLGSLALLTHDEYFTIVRETNDHHEDDIEFLESLHAESFPQWTFELSQGFNLCLYGYGSKRRLLHKFAGHLHSRSQKDKGDKIVMINGYAPNTTMREILSTIGSAVDPAHRIPLTQPAVMVPAILSHLNTNSSTITLVVNSIDAAPLRKPGSQTALAQLAAHPRVRLVCSADTPDFALLWDIGVRSAFNMGFHDCTTFAPYTAELDVVDEVHELLGRNAHRVNGREGVAFVLRSLPENAKNLFRLLVGEVLIAIEEEGDGGDEPTGVEYRMVYNKAVEEFICSSEMAFRTLLKEFHDHQIITSMKDALGTELLSLPFRKDELEAILEDLTS
ncbi:origin recognition complex subunit 2-domain-containing protein [Fusarium venenatum]|uniref:origin recognition complex subunit 2-domain-containing protein n=1 Tax=Fusarium venenatum TaxID=56646 RepID=UPI001D23244B|nr:origin recognition complex subunit 2-domain-containing protein [Fusarium venenatum]